ncbi:MAG: lactate dehydrogenase [Alphaproteobacteria bacterium]|nr:lactate dehydrogenase [Alphaproteobacteria bacterium]HCP01829.1 lactate dehydrogenase [Rhodospirillaceae bacterium]
MQRFTRDQIEAFMARCFTATGIPCADAATVARLMAEGDMLGKDSHGIFRLPGYIGRLKARGFNPIPDIKIVEDRTAMALLDGDNGMGHLIVNRAAEIAIEKAKKTGVAWVGIRHSNHAGAAGVYSNMALKHDMIGLYVAVGSANHLPPWGGTEPLLSTNPIAVSVPADKENSIILDMATTVTSYGKVKVYAQRGLEMPEGWMVGPDGKALTDASKADTGHLLPIGGPKGYGLALIFGILAGTLNGAHFGKDVIDMNADSSSNTNTGQFYLAVDIAAFMGVDVFKKQVDAVIAEMQSSPTMPGIDGVRMPGAGAHAAYADRSANGIPLPNPLLENLASVADDLSVDRLG